MTRADLVATLVAANTVEEHHTFIRTLVAAIPNCPTNLRVGIPPSTIILEAVKSVLPEAQVSVPFAHVVRAACLASDRPVEELFNLCAAERKGRKVSWTGWDSDSTTLRPGPGYVWREAPVRTKSMMVELLRVERVVHALLEGLR